jgi:hypothetical protein
MIMIARKTVNKVMEEEKKKKKKKKKEEEQKGYVSAVLDGHSLMIMITATRNKSTYLQWLHFWLHSRRLSTYSHSRSTLRLSPYKHYWRFVMLSRTDR